MNGILFAQTGNPDDRLTAANFFELVVKATKNPDK
jgi:hypothetical protein